MLRRRQPSYPSECPGPELHNLRDGLRAESGEGQSFLDDEEPAGLTDRFDDRPRVEGIKLGRTEDFGGDLVLVEQRVECLHDVEHHTSIAENRDVRLSLRADPCRWEQ